MPGRAAEALAVPSRSGGARRGRRPPPRLTVLDQGVASVCSQIPHKGGIMFRRLLTTAGVAAAVAFVVGGGAFASGSGSADDQAQSITVIEKTTSDHFVDVGKPGFSIGDEFFFNSVFWNADQTHRVGVNHGYCVLL